MESQIDVYYCIKSNQLKTLGVHPNQQAIGVKYPDWELPTHVGRPQSLSWKAGNHSHIDPHQGLDDLSKDLSE